VNVLRLEVSAHTHTITMADGNVNQGDNERVGERDAITLSRMNIKDSCYSFQLGLDYQRMHSQFFVLINGRLVCIYENRAYDISLDRTFNGNENSASFTDRLERLRMVQTESRCSFSGLDIMTYYGPEIREGVGEVSFRRFVMSVDEDKHLSFRLIDWDSKCEFEIADIRIEDDRDSELEFIFGHMRDIMNEGSHYERSRFDKHAMYWFEKKYAEMDFITNRKISWKSPDE
jgi:hypothetical protein